eukprot:13267322-Alexandrium_andersonii.AAC.1
MAPALLLPPSPIVTLKGVDVLVPDTGLKRQIRVRNFGREEAGEVGAELLSNLPSIFRLS